MLCCIIVRTPIWPSEELSRTPNEREKDRDNLVSSLIGVLISKYVDFF